MKTETTHVALSRLALIAFFFIIIGCTNETGGDYLSPGFANINSYAFSFDNGLLALAVPFGEYSERSGGRHQIVVLDNHNFEVMAQTEAYLDSSPQYLYWQGSDELLFLLSGNYHNQPKLVAWNVRTGQISQIIFPHNGISLSSSKEQLVAWGDTSELDTDQSRLFFYSANTKEQKSILTLASDISVEEIRDIRWSNDEQNILLLLNTELGDRFYLFSLATKEGEFLPIEQISPLSHFDWDSLNDLLVFSDYRTLYVYSLGFNCFMAIVDFEHSIYDTTWQYGSRQVVYIEYRENIMKLTRYDFGFLWPVTDANCM